MSTDPLERRDIESPPPGPAVRAQAAAWIARLHGPNRTPEVEAGFRRWLGEHPERAAAFELLTETWEKSARLRRRPLEEVASWQSPGFRISFSRAAVATMAIAVLAIIGTVFYLQADALSTDVGEQRTLTLEDGSRVFLNTDTRIAERYDREQRTVELEKGEAFFEVAKRSDWPFVVLVGDQEVRALGTSFVVRRDSEKVAVTLVQGRVSVTTVADSQFPASTAGGKPERPDTVTLTAGQRLTLAARQKPRLDTPVLERVTAWQRGQVALDNTTLADAVAEMNRYSTIRLVIEEPAVAAIPVSGLFRAGDQEDFARAVARTYGLQLRDEGAAIVLAGTVSPRD